MHNVSEWAYLSIAYLENKFVGQGTSEMLMASTRSLWKSLGIVPIVSSQAGGWRILHTVIIRGNMLHAAIYTIIWRVLKLQNAVFY